MPDVSLLLIDDEVDFSAPLAKRLARRGFRVETVSSGKDAIKICAKETFDVILLDVKMAEMDGIKTLGVIKQQHPLVEVVMLTGHVTTETAISSLAMGAYDLLTKPACMEELIRKIEDAAQRRKRNLEQGAP